MQIGGTTQLANGSDATISLNAGAASGHAAQDGTRTSDDTTTSAPSSPSSPQDDAVQISPQGYAAASADGVDSGEEASTGETAAEANAQPVKSLVYGALGLERPDQPADPNHAYAVGQWIAAGITLGGIISLFI
ncbi:MAG TPA: hypothetical protein VMJ11_26500 [Paraburkholderia sp.]|uniref:hypothetical protein n=1 Tax=Paraburkholderia sp. TaxID=1926495 RepID=UPI002BC509B5|nr:hypothetical protein [Paraburkholderia sp.]HTR10140.1 hypothetical protein [Paraburkholderia sp.]